jgi:hypothetical protein
MRLGNPVVDSQKTLAELERPLSHGLVADDDAAGREHLLDRAPTHREAEIQPDRVADDFRRKALAGVDGTCALAHAADYRSGSAVASRPVLTSRRGVLRMSSSNTIKIETARVTRDRFVSVAFDNACRPLATCVSGSAPGSRLAVSLIELLAHHAAVGLPLELRLDNASEYHSRSLKAACLRYGIQLRYEPLMAITARDRSMSEIASDPALIAAPLGRWVFVKRQNQQDPTRPPRLPK